MSQLFILFAAVAFSGQKLIVRWTLVSHSFSNFADTDGASLVDASLFQENTWGTQNKCPGTVFPLSFEICTQVSAELSPGNYPQTVRSFHKPPSDPWYTAGTLTPKGYIGKRTSTEIYT